MNAPIYLDVEEAKRLPGLRLVVGRGMPGPWSVAACAILDVKGIPFTAVPHDAGAENEAVCRWTGQVSAPVAMLDSDRPRGHWSEILLLAERLRPDPPLIPADQAERTLMWGLCHELCGEDGLGWTCRCLIFAAQQAAGNVPYPSLLAKYSSGYDAQHHRRRLNQLIAMLQQRLAAQAAVGSTYLIGRTLSAADIYWTAFSNMLEPMSAAHCKMPAFYRGLGEFVRPYLDGPLPASILAQRDYILDEHLLTPIEL